MALSGRDRARYARHLLLAQLGEAGQERLLAARVVANGDADPGALAVARRYLTRAGVHVRGAVDTVAGAVDTVAPPSSNDPSSSTGTASPLRVATTDDVETMAGHPSLREAARALAGALSAVNTLQSLIGVRGSTLSGAPVQPQIVFAISSEEA